MYLRERFNDEESPAAKSSNSDRSFPADGPATFADQAWRLHRRAMTHEKSADVQLIWSIDCAHCRTTRTVCVRVTRLWDDRPPLEIVKPRDTPRLRVDPPRGGAEQSARRCHPCREVTETAGHDTHTHTRGTRRDAIISVRNRYAERFRAGVRRRSRRVCLTGWEGGGRLSANFHTVPHCSTSFRARGESPPNLPNRKWRLHSEEGSSRHSRRNTGTGECDTVTRENA